MENTELIVVRQLPIIEQQLLSLKEKWEKAAADAEAMVCNEETIQSCKKARAELNKELDALEERRKSIKREIMEPYNRFVEIYEECVTGPGNRAFNTYSKKIMEVESEQKRRCEEGLRDYFAELCAVHHLDWLEYERAGIKIDMASAKAKVPGKLRKQLVEFVVNVSNGVKWISTLENSDEIMVEFKRSLNLNEAVYIVKNRHVQIEEERHAQETRKAALQQEAESIRRVEALAPPVQVEKPKTVKCTFTVRATMEQLKKLKEFLNMEGIEYQ